MGWLFSRVSVPPIESLLNVITAAFYSYTRRNARLWRRPRVMDAIATEPSRAAILFSFFHTTLDDSTGICLFILFYISSSSGREREDAALSFGHIFTSNLFRLLFRQYWAHAAAKTRQRKRKTDDYFFPFNKKKGRKKHLNNQCRTLARALWRSFLTAILFSFIPTAHWIEKPQRSLLLNISCI